MLFSPNFLKPDDHFYLDILQEDLSSDSTLPSTKGLREIVSLVVQFVLNVFTKMLQSKELNGLVSQPLLDASTKPSTARYTSSPSFLTSREYPLSTANGAAEINHQSHNSDIENEHKLWAGEKDSLQKQIQVVTCIISILGLLLWYC